MRRVSLICLIFLRPLSLSLRGLRGLSYNKSCWNFVVERDVLINESLVISRFQTRDTLWENFIGEIPRVEKIVRQSESTRNSDSREGPFRGELTDL